MKLKTGVVLCAILMVMSFAFSQDRADVAVVNRIWHEGVDRSEVMKTLSYFTDVIGPRIPASPAMKKACDYAVKRFGEFGMKNVAVEPSGDFGLGWSNDFISLHMIAQAYQPITAFPVPRTDGTKGRISGNPVLVQIQTKLDFDRYHGKLRGAIVFTETPRATKPSFKATATRLSDSDPGELMEMPVPMRPKSEPDKPEPLKWEELQEFYRMEGVGVLVESSSLSRATGGLDPIRNCDGYFRLSHGHAGRNATPKTACDPGGSEIEEQSGD